MPRLIRSLTLFQASLNGERRITQPYGMHGGQPGERGCNYWLRKSAVPGTPDRKVKLKPAAAFK